MKKLLFVFLILFQACMPAAQEQENDFSIMMNDSCFMKDLDTLQSVSDITEMIDKVERCKKTYIDALDLIHDQIDQKDQEIYDLDIFIQSQDKQAIKDNFLNAPEDIYYKRMHLLPEKIKPLTFALIRDKAGLRRNPESDYWKNAFNQSTQELLQSITDENIVLMYPDTLFEKFNTMAELQKSVELDVVKEAKLAQQLAQFRNVFKHLLIQQEKRQNKIDASWQNIARSYASYQANLVTQSRMRDFIAFAGKENLKRTVVQDAIEDILAATFDSIEVYEKKEQELLKLEKEKQKKKAKAARQKENKKNAVDKQKQEDDLLEAAMKESKKQDCAMRKARYLQNLDLQGHLSVEQKKLAQIGFDVSELNLISDQGGIENEGDIAIFLTLFQDLLQTSGFDQHAIWRPCLARIEALHRVLKSRKQSLYDYIVDKEAFIKILNKKELEAEQVRKSLIVKGEAERIERLCKEADMLIASRNQLKEKSQLLNQGAKKVIDNQILNINKEISDINKVIMQWQHKCQQIFTLGTFMDLQDTDKAFPLFEDGFPVLDACGKLTDEIIMSYQDRILELLQENWSMKPCSSVSQHEDALIAFNLIFNELLEQFSLFSCEQDEIVRILVTDSIQALMNLDKFTPAFREGYFQALCRTNKMNEKSWDINALADIAKIQNVVMNIVMKYQKHKR